MQGIQYRIKRIADNQLNVRKRGLAHAKDGQRGFTNRGDLDSCTRSDS